MKRILTLCLTAGILSCSQLVFSEEKPKVEVSGYFWLQYLNDLSDSPEKGTKSQSSFELNRMQIHVKGAFTDKVKANMVLEAQTPEYPGGSLKSPFVKNIVLEMADLLPLPGNKIIIGIPGTPWIGQEEGIWKHRFIYRVQADADAGVKSNDRGIGIAGKIPNSYGDYAITYGNGEGGTGNFDDKYKDVQARLTVSPVPSILSGLKLHLFKQIGKQTSNGKKNDVLIGGLSLEDKAHHLMASYLRKEVETTSTITSPGLSIHGSYKITPEAGIFTRFDSWDPDKDKSDDAYKRIVLGATYSPFKDIRFAVSYIAKNLQKETETKKNQKWLSLHAEVKY
ncbi:MAG: hypothetical protein AB1797_13270 [bacterium]